MAVWCALIPPDELERFSEHEDDLRSVSEVYEDWLVSMRGKSFVGTDVGMLLDRIRILMIHIGIACAMDRALAEEVQAVVSEYLRRGALMMVDQLPSDSVERAAVRKTLTAFFSGLKFTRDIFPEEDVRSVIPLKVSVSTGSSKGGKGQRVKAKSKTSKVDKEQTLQAALLESSNILKKLYMRLLSPDPWGTY
jgi:hypothetical protein